MLAGIQGQGEQIAARQRSGVLTTVQTPEDFASLRPQWNELLSSSASDCIFLTWEWMHTWWKHLARTRRLAIAALHEGEELQALAPLAVQWPRVEFCGSGFAGSDYLDFIVRDGCEPRALAPLVSHLRRQNMTLKLANLRRHENFATEVANALGSNGWRVSEAQTNICPFIPLRGHSWDSYLGSLGAEHRYNFNRRFRQLNREFAVTFEQARTREQVHDFTDLVIAQHNRRWKERGGSDAFHTPELIAFHREFTLTALERGWLRLFVLFLDGRPAASLYGFFYNRVFYFYQSGFESEYQKYSVGLVTMGLAIKSAIEEGASEYDLLHGDEAYKSRWARESRDLGRLELYPPGMFGSLHRTAIALGRGAKRISGSVKGLVA